MTGLLARAGGLFVTADPAPARPAVTAPATRLAAVLAAPGDLLAAAGGVAVALRAEARSRTVVVCRPGDPLPHRPATPSATAVARRLMAREMRAAAAGTVCRVALAPDPAGAVRDVWRLLAAVDVPVVLALPGRLEGFDDLLAEADHLSLAAPEAADETVVALALGSLGRLGPPVARVTPPSTAVGRRLAAAGLAAVGPLRRPQDVPA